MLQGKRGELRNLFSVQQTDALEAWLRSVQPPGPEFFLITQSVAQAVGSGYQFLGLDYPLANANGYWDAAGQFLKLPIGSSWTLRLYVSSDTATPGAQRNELFLGEAGQAAGLAARRLDFGYQDRPAGFASPAFGAARDWIQGAGNAEALRPIVRFNGGTTVNTIPGQGFTALSGTRIA